MVITDYAKAISQGNQESKSSIRHAFTIITLFFRQKNRTLKT